MRVSITKYSREELLTTSSTLASALIEGLGRAGVAVAELDSDIILDKAVQMAIKLIDRIADVDKVQEKILSEVSDKISEVSTKDSAYTIGENEYDAIVEKARNEYEIRKKKELYNYKYNYKYKDKK